MIINFSDTYNKILIFMLIFILLFSEGNMAIITLPFIVLCFFSLLCFSYKNVIGYCHLIYKSSLAVKFLFFFIISIICGFFTNFIFYNASFSRFVIGFGAGYLLHFIFTFLIGTLITFRLKKETVIQLFISALLIILCGGLIEFILYKNGSQLFQPINILCSGRQYVNVAPRIQSLFAEPSHYAWFLVCNIPLAFEIYKSKYRIYKNKLVNKVVKKIILPILLISIILTQSSINLIFGLILTILYILSANKITLKQIIKYILPAFIILSCIGLILMHININETYLNRIVKSIPILFDINTLIIIEPSLATRIISYINYTILFIKHPLLGIGCGQLISIFPTQLLHSPVNLTVELMLLANSPKVNGINPSIFFKILAETGIIGIILFMAFLLKIKQYAKYLLSKNQNFYSNWYQGITYTILFFMFLTIYDSSLYNHYFWILFGTTVGFYIKQRNKLI